MMMNSMGNCSYYEAGGITTPFPISSNNPNYSSSYNLNDLDIFMGGSSSTDNICSRSTASATLPPPAYIQLPPLMLSSATGAMTSAEEDLEAKPCKSHKEAERRRRKRINAHLATLRSLLPNLLKTDKASVLGEVVRQLQELKKAASELTAGGGGDDDHDHHDRCDWDPSKPCLLLGDTDHVNLRRSENDTSILVATLCCEDRPELIGDLTRALRSVKGTVVRARIATVGGRTKAVLWVRGVSGGSGGGGGGAEGLLRRALKVVVEKTCGSNRSAGLGHLGLFMGTRMHHHHPYYC